VFLYSLDGLLADEGTEYWQFCFGLPVGPAETKQKLDVYPSAYTHIMGRAAYEGMAGALPTADHPFTGTMNAAPNSAKWRRSQSRAERWFCEPVKSIENRTDGEWCELRVEEDQWA
jgi:dihydrofolate reductase